MVLSTEKAPLRNILSTTSIACKIVDVSALNSTTHQVELESTTKVIPHYIAGQYLQLQLDLNNDGRIHSFCYSIANSSNSKQSRRLMLFILNTSNLADRIVTYLIGLQRTMAIVNVKLPMGQAYLQTNLSLPHLLIATGSGISKIKCLSEEILRQNPDAEVHVYWSNRKLEDFYLINEFNKQTGRHKNFTFHPILESPHSKWPGRSGFLFEVIRKDFERFDNFQTYLCGSPAMVYSTIDKLIDKGLKEDNCYSDVFEYAPRKSRSNLNF